MCKIEQAAYQKAYREANKEKLKAKAKAFRDANKEKIKARRKTYWDSNKEKVNARNKAYKKANREKILATNKVYRERHPEKIASLKAKRRASKLCRTPPWLNPIQLAEIESFYIERDIMVKLTGNQYHVDHIVPLQGDNISGLHVPWNLQVLTAYDNTSKGNRYA